MSTNQPDSEQIRKYLNGELDARAMHQLERQAQDDPFLMDALEGYNASAPDQRANMADLTSRLSERLTQKKKPVLVLWRILPIAATLIIALTFGWLWLSPKGEDAPKEQVAKLNKQPKFTIPGATISPQKLPSPTRIDSVPATVHTQVSYQNSNTDRKYLAVKIHHQPNTSIKPVQPVDTTAANLTISEALANRAQSLDITTAAVTQFHKEKTEGKIAGKVTDAEGHGLPGARLIVKGSNTKVLSNNNGEFFLPIDAIKDSVTVQMMGYVTKRLAVNATDKFDIKLDEDATTLAAVEVTHKMRPADIHDAQPQLGWAGYKAYLKEKAVMPDGETGRVKLKFYVDTEGRISNVRVIRGRSDTMNQKAIAMVLNGPEWYGNSDSKLKEIKLKIKFHKG